MSITANLRSKDRSAKGTHRKTISTSLLAIALLFCAQIANAGDVYYSVGTNTADLKTGAPTISITSGTATLSLAQTGNIGVGDEIDYDTGNTIAYIKSVISPTQFVVHTATGGVSGDVTPVTVNAIRRAFNTIANAVANSSDGSHLTTTSQTTS